MTRLYHEFGPGIRAAFLQSPMLTAGGTMRRAPGPAVWSPDGRSIAFVWARGGENQLWVIPANGGWAVQVSNESLKVSVGMNTLFDRRLCDRVAWSPDSSEIVFPARYKDEKQVNLWAASVKGGLRRLTSHRGADRTPAFSPDGKWIAFTCTSDGRDAVWMVPVEGGLSLQLTFSRYDDMHPRWSPDGKWILFTSQRSESDFFNQDIFVIGSKGGAIQTLTNNPEASSRYARWSPDGKHIYYITDESGYDEVWCMAADGGSKRQVTPATGQDKGEFAVSPDGRRLAYESIRRSNIDLVVMPAAGGEGKVLVSGMGENTLPEWSPDGKEIVYLHSGPAQAPDLWVVGAQAGSSRQLTFTMMGNLDGENLVIPEEVYFKGVDGVPIDGLLYHPQDIRKGKKYPAVLMIHGGPNAQTFNTWWPCFQYLISKGYVILAPNCHGSQGYGRAFMDSIRHGWADKDLQDWEFAAGYLKSLAYVDPERIGIWGRSYGGYAVVTACTHKPDLFKAGVCQFGATNLISRWELISAPVRTLARRMMGLPIENLEKLRAASAAPFVDALKTPILFLHGGADDGVVPQQTEEMAAAMEKVGKIHEVRIYEGEGHGFLETDHVLDAADRIEAFLDKYLKG